MMEKKIKRYSVYKKLPNGKTEPFGQPYAEFITKGRAQSIADAQNDSERTMEKLLSRRIHDESSFVYKKTIFFIKEV